MAPLGPVRPCSMASRANSTGSDADDGEGGRPRGAERQAHALRLRRGQRPAAAHRRRPRQHAHQRSAEAAEGEGHHGRPRPRPPGTLPVAGHGRDPHRHRRRPAAGRRGPSGCGAGGSTPGSAGEASRRLGWSTSWASGSTVSRPAMNMATPASTRSGVVPDQIPRRQSPATTPSSTSRGDAGGRPAQDAAQPADEHGPAAGAAHAGAATTAAGGQLHGELAAQHDHGPQVLQRGGEAQLADQGRPPLGRLERHAAEHGQADQRPARAAATTGTRPSDLEPQRPQRQITERGGGAPRDGVDPVGHAPARAGPSPTSDATQRGRRAPAATRAAPRGEPDEREAGERAGGDPGRGAAGHPPRRPSPRRCRRPPAPTKARNRSWRIAGARSAVVRSTGARSTWRTSARSRASGPPRLPERRPRATAKAAATPIQPGTVARPRGRAGGR